MIPELGQFALVLALIMALIQGSLPLLGAQRGNAAWIGIARPVAYAQATFVAIAFLILSYAFVTQDFSVVYVAQNSNSLLPVAFQFNTL